MQFSKYFMFLFVTSLLSVITGKEIPGSLDKPLQLQNTQAISMHCPVVKDGSIGTCSSFLEEEKRNTGLLTERNNKLKIQRYPSLSDFNSTTKRISIF